MAGSDGFRAARAIGAISGRITRPKPADCPPWRSMHWSGENGVTAFGKWLRIGDKWYYFCAEGKPAMNTAIDGYEAGADGVRME